VRPARHYTPPPHAADTLPVPPARGLLPGAARFFEQQGQGSLLRRPRCQFLAHCTRAWDQRDEPNPLLQAQCQRACTVRFAIHHDTAHSIESQRETFLDDNRRLGAITRVAIVNPQAQWQSSITAYPETQKHLLEIIGPIFAVPIGRTRRHRALWRLGGLAVCACRRLIGTLQGNRRRILMEPRRWDRIDLERPPGHGAKHPIEICGNQGIEGLAQSIVI
jgi:hypothetical protein